MKEIRAEQITAAVKQLVIDAAYELEPDILDALVAARDRESSPLARNILELLLTNADIASRERMPICQDTGIGVVFVTLGQELLIRESLEDAIQEGVRRGYEEGYLRKSVCAPLSRVNTGTNTPAVVHYDVVVGDGLVIRFLPKGCGSENMSGLAMLPPSAGRQGIIDFVVGQVIRSGSNPCPPVVVGVGIGGTFEKAALLAKMALLRPLGESSSQAETASLEDELLVRINKSGQGVQGLGGNNTALAVQIETFPTHIASLPVAVNIQCHAHRHKEIVL
jgi:fumarate hydratase subunit alpha